MLQSPQATAKFFVIQGYTMNEGLIRRLTNLCKDHYVLRTIDDLFILAGADLEWCIKRGTPPGKSEREDRFNCWITGIRDKSPKQEDTILLKVAAEVARNPDIPEQQCQALNEALAHWLQVKVSAGLSRPDLRFSFPYVHYPHEREIQSQEKHGATYARHPA